MTSPQQVPIGVIGGGRMGAGIAHVFAAAGCQVTVVEPGQDVSSAVIVMIFSAGICSTPIAAE
jgi:3-hydroxybutyryl-CoA dehydrogenase